MLPSVLTSQLQQGVEDFLRTTFPTTTPHFHGMLDRFFDRNGTVFKGPYVSVDLPFRHSGHGPDYFPEVPLEFPPYAHQAEAFERLRGEERRSTLVATGTGSGKTESFLWPILDDVRQRKDEDGIKAILIYPMNALANDQAGRIATAVDDIEALDGVRAGLYVGQYEKTPTLTMGPDHVITDRQALRLDPPDVLLTNYKMLDYLLTRPKDATLWRYNEPETLRTLVVDELHTFDGAQGTDLACLIRRLKDRLGAPDGHVCCVGTSATLGGAEDFDALRSYAEDVFGEPFEEGAVIGEKRQSTGDFLQPVEYTAVPGPEHQQALQPGTYNAPDAYIAAQVSLWLEDEDVPDVTTEEGAIRLGTALRKHAVFHELVRATEAGPTADDELRGALAEAIPAFCEGSDAYREALLHSILSLCSWARSRVETREGTEAGPFVQVRAQLWLRELRRMVGSIEEEPALSFWDDLPETSSRDPHLPLAHCLECGSMGWIGIHRQNEAQFQDDLKGIYQRYFDSAPTFSFAFPVGPDEEIEADGSRHELCGYDLHFSDPGAETCEACGRGDRLLTVFRPHNRKTTQDNRQVGSSDCPFCGTRNGLTIVGSRAASLTSVLISQLYASTYNEDKTLLTFSDSVQDAAHRAGFFQARTYRFNLRGAIQKFVDRAETPLSLSALQDAVVQHYEDRMEPEAFVSTFIAPDMEWLREFETLKEEGTLADETLTNFVRRRLRWETWSEYGFRARIGRTLEKTGSSVAQLDSDRLEAATDALLPTLRNEVGDLRDVTRADVRQFMRGIAQHLKNQGAVAHSELETYIEQSGNGYLLHKRPHLPRFGRRSRLPAFISERATNRFDPVHGGSSRTGRSWLGAWAIKCFGDHDPMLPSVLGALYSTTLPTLVRSGVLAEWTTTNGFRVWGLPADALLVDHHVAQSTCDACGHHVSVAAPEAETWPGMPCLRYQCTGAYGIPEENAENYYRHLYREGDLRRIVAREHTGLLERDKREDIEASFQNGEQPWDPNLLSCTPTLELGVDVGQLSSVILCSVPPSTASFVQRIGRGGRRSGNAIDVTVANGRPHDLYFFEDPTEMIDGDVEPPGVFLGAVEVLVRQFVAYCFDRWVGSGVSEEAVPNELSSVLRGLDDENIFPHTWLTFVEQNEEELLDAFIGIFGDVLSDERASALRRALQEEGGIEVRVLEKLGEIKKRRANLKRRSRRLYREIRKLRDNGLVTEAQETNIEEMEQEKTALQDIYQRIGKKNTYNFFTDAGLLPNYAFPESGVTLRSILYRMPEEGGQEVWDEEFVRPAPQALRELAPGSTFYADGRRVVVDQIDLSGDDSLEQWRFCDRCAYTDDATTGDTSHVCPQCGSPNWSDQGQQRTVIKHDEVRATTADRKSRIDDSSDGRDREFFETGLLVHFDRADTETAYRIDNDAVPFGFEYVESATFREVNFGRPTGQPLMNIGGQEVNGQGFRTCTDCGRVAINDNEIDHTRSCSVHQDTTAEPPIETLFLYRQIESEAVRILLPETSFSVTPEKVESFKAALELGLEETYEGSVDHLKTAIQEGPSAQTTARRRYLIIYDAVPGGTGYLADLLRDRENLLDLLKDALGVLADCPCTEEEDKDGCYQCLYAYRNHYDMPHTSRAAAQELLKEILDHRDQLVEIDTIDSISVHGVLESELEARFIHRLRELDIDASYLEKAKVGSKQGYVLQLGDHEFEIEPQVAVGPKEGVPRSSTIDFVIRPRDADLKPIAVFLDGLQYHRNRIGTDLAQRRALRASDQYYVWSLTWGDVTRESSPAHNYLKSAGTTFRQLITNMGEPQANKASTLAGAGSFEGLIDLLQTQDTTLWKRVAVAQALLWVRHQTERDRWIEAAEARLPSPLVSALQNALDGDRVIGLDTEPSGEASSPVTIWALTSPRAVQSLPHGIDTAMDETWVAVHLDDDVAKEDDRFEAVWNGVLRLHNFLQFLPQTHPVSADREAFDGYEDLLDVRDPGSTLRDHLPEGPSWGAFDEQEWKLVTEYADERVQDVLPALRDAEVPAPDNPFELQSDGAIVATAELGWSGPDVAIMLDGQPEREKFERRGWTVFTASELDDPDPILGALTGADSGG
jgi:DEAD/DEAH box helicase domain-containing protein